MEGSHFVWGNVSGQPSSNKGWHGEIVKIRGGDLAYLLEYKKPDGVTVVVPRTERLAVNEKKWAKDFVGGKTSGLWEQREVWDPKFLVTHYCNRYYLLYSRHVDRMLICYILCMIIRGFRVFSFDFIC